MDKKNKKGDMYENATLESIKESPQVPINYETPPFKACDRNQPYMFVSYSHTDKKIVYPIIHKLHNLGLRIWYDEGIPTSVQWQAEISRTLKKCSVFLVFITRASMNSMNVLNECHMAAHRYKQKEIQFIPIYLENVELAEGLDLEISSIQAIYKYLISDEVFYQKILEDLNYNIIDKELREEFRESTEAYSSYSKKKLFPNNKKDNQIFLKQKVGKNIINQRKRINHFLSFLFDEENTNQRKNFVNPPVIPFQQREISLKNNLNSTLDNAIIKTGLEIVSEFLMDSDSPKYPSNLLYFIGAMGSGKTTLLERIEYEAWKGESIIQTERIPIFITCNDLLEYCFSDSLNKFIQLLSEYINNFYSESIEITINEIKNGRFLFLFDSLDEIPREKQNILYNIIHEFSRIYNNKIIITIRESDFTTLTLPDYEINSHCTQYLKEWEENEIISLIEQDLEKKEKKKFYSELETRSIESNKQNSLKEEFREKFKEEFKEEFRGKSKKNLKEKKRNEKTFQKAKDIWNTWKSLPKLKELAKNAFLLNALLEVSGDVHRKIKNKEAIYRKWIFDKIIDKRINENIKRKNSLFQKSKFVFYKEYIPTFLKHCYWYLALIYLAETKPPNLKFRIISLNPIDREIYNIILKFDNGYIRFIDELKINGLLLIMNIKRSGLNILFRHKSLAEFLVADATSNWFLYRNQKEYWDPEFIPFSAKYYTKETLGFLLEMIEEDKKRWEKINSEDEIIDKNDYNKNDYNTYEFDRENGDIDNTNYIEKNISYIDIKRFLSENCKPNVLRQILLWIENFSFIKSNLKDDKRFIKMMSILLKNQKTFDCSIQESLFFVNKSDLKQLWFSKFAIFSKFYNTDLINMLLINIPQLIKLKLNNLRLTKIPKSIFSKQLNSL